MAAGRLQIGQPPGAVCGSLVVHTYSTLHESVGSQVALADGQAAPSSSVVHKLTPGLGV